MHLNMRGWIVHGQKRGEACPANGDFVVH